MADDGEDTGLAPLTDERGLVAADDQHVDRSQLKLPTGVQMVGKEASGEENEEVLCKL
jgi:hypothetical protein